jgi:hypothetical protein
MNTKRLIISLFLGFVWSALAFSVNSTAAASTDAPLGKEPLSASSNQKLSTQQAPTSPSVPLSMNSKVIAYYFHGTARCANCRTIEQYSREAIQKFFTQELKSGKLEFRTVNVDLPQNRHYIQHYSLFTRSLVITLWKNNKQEQWKNLQRVWSYLRDKNAFYQYVKDEVEALLHEAE